MAGFVILAIVGGVILICGIFMWVTGEVILRHALGNTKLNGAGDILWGIGAIVFIISIIFLSLDLPIGIGLNLQNQRDKDLYIEKAQMIEQVIESSGDLENAGISNAIIEYNSWLAEAKTSKARYGIWSSYYYVDISGMDYLTSKG